MASFDFEVAEPKLSPHELPKFDFVERLRNQLDLVLEPAQRKVETFVLQPALTSFRQPSFLGSLHFYDSFAARLRAAV